MKEISALIVGKSGAGKSEFIGSFSESSALINSSGGGQTTRTSVEYNFFMHEIKPYVQINFLSEEQFIEKRISQIDELVIPIKKYDPSIKEQVLEIEGFFNYTEFDFDDKTISKQIDTLWDEVLPIDLQKYDYTLDEYEMVKEKIKRNIGVELEEQSDAKDSLFDNDSSNYGPTNYKLTHIVELLIQAAYKILRNSIKNFPNRFELINISEENKRKLTYCLKVDDNNHSVTGIISKIVINDNIKSIYKDLLTGMGISKLTFIDTYGLDHDKTATDEVLENRYNILFKEFPNIETVFFVRALGSDSPTDLASAIPLIYASKPSVVPYVVFTKIDQNEIIEAQANKSKIDLVELNNKKQIKAVNYFLNKKNERHIKKILSDSNIPEILIESRYEVLLNNLIPYCSIEVDCYEDNNREQVAQLFSSILYKEHLGNSLVNINALKALSDDPDFKIELTKLLKAMFSKSSKDWSSFTLQRRTIGANRKRLENDVLGYDGTYLDSWQSRFNSGYNQVFSKISVTDFEKIFKLPQNTNESTAIQEILNQFSRFFLNFDNQIRRDGDYQNEAIKTILVEKNPEYVQNQKFVCMSSPIHKWLTAVYDFKGYFDSINEDIYEVVLNRFLNNFIADCRDHNIRILARSIKSKKDSSEKIVADYLLDYDNILENKSVFIEKVKSLYNFMYM